MCTSHGLPPPLSPIRQGGSALAEFLLAAPLLLMLGLGGLETARWLHQRQAVNLALLQAARAGITQHARPEAIALAFEQALQPMHAAATPQATAGRLADSLQERRRRMGAAPWQIEILSPSAAAFAQHTNMRLSVRDAGPLPRIDNDYQWEQRQQARHASARLIAAPDPLASPDIYQANTLHLRLTYPYAPLVPGVGALLATLADQSAGYARSAWRNGYLPMRQEIRLGMASHPVDWPPLADGRVVKAKTNLAGNHPENGHPPVAARPACVGIWCMADSTSTTPVSSVDGMKAILPEGWADGWPHTMVRLPTDAASHWLEDGQNGLLCSAP